MLTVVSECKGLHSKKKDYDINMIELKGTNP